MVFRASRDLRALSWALANSGLEVSSLESTAESLKRPDFRELPVSTYLLWVQMIRGLLFWGWSLLRPLIC